MKKLLTLLLVLVLALTVFTACGNKPVEESEANGQNEEAVKLDSEYIKEKGKLIVGITDFAPMDYKEAGDEWIGFDADMARAFAKKLGVDIEFVEIDWDTKIMELNNKSIDCVWNGMTLTDEVKSSMECSEPYCNNAQIVVVPADKAEEYANNNSWENLQYAVEAGSAGKEVAEEKGYTVTEVKDQATALMEVASGTSDAAIIDSLMAAAMVGEGTGYSQLTYTIELNSEEYGVGFRKGSDLAEKLNEFFKESYENGSLRECAEKYKVQAALIEN